MSVFGWCQTNQHKDCKHRYQRFYIGPVGKGRNKKQGVIYLDEWRECECWCHKPEDERPKPKKKAAKKAATRRKK